MCDAETLSKMLESLNGNPENTYNVYEYFFRNVTRETINQIIVNGYPIVFSLVVRFRYDEELAFQYLTRALVLGADPNALSTQITTTYAICYCVGAYEDKNVAELLLDYGADLNSTYLDGSNLLFEACSIRHTRMATILYERGLRITVESVEWYGKFLEGREACRKTCIIVAGMGRSGNVFRSKDVLRLVAKHIWSGRVVYSTGHP